MIIRALNQLREIRFREAIRIFAGIHDVYAYRLTIDWLLRRYYPRRFSSVGRTVIWRDERAMESMSVGSARFAGRSFANCW
jgi:hypothetical protein